MKRKVGIYALWAGVVLAIYAATVFGIASLMRPAAKLPPQAEVTPSPEPSPTRPPAVPSPSPEKGEETPFEAPAQADFTTYIVKEEGGKVYVYVEGDPTPQKTLDIQLDNLRQYDRERFAQGIALHSMEELAQLEEDFSE